MVTWKYQPLLIAVGFAMLSTGCSSIPFHSTAVVPTKNPLPYSANVKVTEVASYIVEPGASMVADPSLQNRITTKTASMGAAKEDWEKGVLDYLATRQTFRHLGKTGPADVDLTVRIIVYIDPSLEFKWNHIYVARTEATIHDPRNGRPLASYSGFGKAVGEVSREGKGDDAEPVNRAVHAALNDLFGKMEGDSRQLAQL